NLQARAGHAEEALDTLHQAVTHQKFAFDRAPQMPGYRRALSIAYGALAEVERVMGKPSGSAAALLERRKLWSEHPQELYKIASGLAATANEDQRRKEKQRRTGEEIAARPRYEDEAVATLRQAVACGFSDLERVEKQVEFNGLRSRDDFQRVLAEIKK